MRRFAVGRVSVLALGWLGPLADRGAALQGPRRADSAAVHALAARTLAAWEVPGLAVGVVERGKVVAAIGVGYRDLERRLPVTPRTVFGIGSNTKSFTALVIGTLVDQGRLEFDRPVQSLLPDFVLMDPVATRHATVRDLLDHMTGLPRHDGMWYGRSLDRPTIFRRLRHLEPSSSFRGRWQYNNLMYLTLGYLAERLTGETWDDLVRRRIFAPLGMTESNTSYREQMAASDAARTYEARGGRLEYVPLRDIDNVGPAGSINSTVLDMLRYVGFFLDSGTVAGRSVVSKEVLRALQSGRVVVGTDVALAAPAWSEIGPSLYALGLLETYYRGRRTVNHQGGIDGYTSSMSWMPDRRVGVVVLTNSTTPAAEALTYEIYDLFLGHPSVDWSARMKAAAGSGPPLPEPPRAGPVGPPSHPLPAFAGEYEHPGYGLVRVAVEGSRLALVFDRLRTGLDHVHFDTFRSDSLADRWGIIPSLRSFTVTFRTAVDGSIGALEIPFERSVAPIQFRRVTP